MKRILLTTTSLVLAAGVAQADITFSGSTGIALIDDNGASTVQTNSSLVSSSSSSRAAASQRKSDNAAANASQPALLAAELSTRPACSTRSCTTWHSNTLTRR